MKSTIYVLTNPSIPNMVRIGNTHAAEANVHYPVPYECYFFQELKQGEDILQGVYTVLGQQRKHPTLDFFTVSPEHAKEIIQQVYKWHTNGINIAQASVQPVQVTGAKQFDIFFEEAPTIASAPVPAASTSIAIVPVATVPQATAPAVVPVPAKTIKRRRPLSLFKIGLERGDKIFSFNGHIAEVYSARKVKYKNHLYSLTDLNKKCVNKARAFGNWKNEFGVTLEQLADMKYKEMGIPKQ